MNKPIFYSQKLLITERSTYELLSTLARFNVDP